MVDRAGAPGIGPAIRRLLASVIAVSSSENSSAPIDPPRGDWPGAVIPGLWISKTFAHFVHLIRLTGTPPKRDSS